MQLPQYSTPPLTVLMTVFNGEAHLKEAVESILDQTFSNFIFLILDNASDDATSSILAEYARRDSRIRVVTNEKNLGQTGALNKGLALTDTPYVARMDADDIALPHRFYRQLAFMEAHPEVTVLGGSILGINKDGGQNGWSWRPPCTPEMIRLEMTTWQGRAIPHPAAMLRTQALKEVKGYCPALNYVQDYDLWHRLLENGCAIASLAGEPLLLYRQYERANSARNAIKALEHVLALIACDKRNNGEPDPLKHITEPTIELAQSLLSPDTSGAFAWLALLPEIQSEDKKGLIIPALRNALPYPKAMPTDFPLDAVLRWYAEQYPDEAWQAITQAEPAIKKKMQNNLSKVALHSPSSCALLHTLVPLPVPQCIPVQNSNICNANCIFCQYSLNIDKKQIMPFELFKKIADDFHNEKNDGVIHFIGTGEVFTDKNIIEKIAYAKNLGLKVYITTNGTLFHKWNLVERTLDFHPERIYISTPGFSAEAYATLFGVNNYDEFFPALIKFFKYKEKYCPQTHIGFGFRSNRTYEDVINDDDYKKHVKYFVDNNIIFNELNRFEFDSWSGQILDKAGSEIKIVDHSNTQSLCKKLYTPQLSVLADGSLKLCGCIYIKTEYDSMVIGNLASQSLAECLSQQAIHTLFKNYLLHKEIPEICRRCTRGHDR
ncbi:MAG: glycosyltransferase [Desulfovibrio sp.]|uniref:glycosyltransferase n=1 Tax=Desulfovibrio sp. TaxID=885 RepID=UPI0039E688A3